MEEIVRIPFQKVNRSYFSTPSGWRLATFEETRAGLETIKEHNILERWDRVRLLDGWMLGPGYDFQMGNDFKGCLGYMLLIQTDTSGDPYAKVTLSELGKEVALFLCVDDWNYEVVYWLLNSWSNSEAIELRGQRRINLPFSNAAEFEMMNEMLCRLTRRLGEKVGAACEKGRKTKYSGRDSVMEVLSGMIEIISAEKDNVEYIGNSIWQFISYEGNEYLLPASVQTEDVADGYWSFVCDAFAGYVVEVYALQSLLQIHQMKVKRSGKNLMIATSILLYLSRFRRNIIHEPLRHDCQGNCSGKILSYAAEKAVGDPHRFSQILQGNAMWRCYDETGVYTLINKLLLIVAEGSYSNIETGLKNVNRTVVRMLLKCGADIRNGQIETALRKAAKWNDEDVSTEVGEALLARCDEESRYDFVNAADASGLTALHIASQEGKASLCKKLLEFGASLKHRDQEGMTPLHYALEGGIDAVIDLFMESRHVSEIVDLKDGRGYTPFDIAFRNSDYPSMAKLLSKSQDPDVYLSKVNMEELLRHSLLIGSVDIVYKLLVKGIRLPAGECDDDGRTALHLAAMCGDDSSAVKILELVCEIRSAAAIHMVGISDRRGRTVLHEAALQGHRKLCEILLKIQPKLIYLKDKDDRNPLYDAVGGNYEDTALYKQLMAAYIGKDIAQDFVDRNGVTPLHVAASQGKAKFVREILSSERIKKKYLSRGDRLGETALHKAAKCGDMDTVNIILTNGADPLRERDCDGRTALHYAVHAKTGDKIELAKRLLSHFRSDEEKALLLWASAEGLGTADQNLPINDPLKRFFQDEKYTTRGQNLLRIAAYLGEIEMVKELISRGYQIQDIRDPEWQNQLTQRENKNVRTVLQELLRQVEIIPERGNDHPSLLDHLGRSDYARGLAALFLNPGIKPPITVGIAGTWGMGKSSLMLQTENILLTTAAQMALLPSSELNSVLPLPPNIEILELSREGRRKYFEIERQMNCGQKRGYSLADILSKYDTKHHPIFKSIAAMDASCMFNTYTNTPAVLTVQYNAWMYKNNTEALAGMAVEITRELEGIMTPAQWFSTCWRNTWRSKKRSLLLEFILPCLLAVVLASSLTWVAWVVFGSEKLKEWANVKYAWPPVAAAILFWKITKSVMGIIKPVSAQLINYTSLPDHSDRLGYQARVISDLKFLKQEIGKDPYAVFTAFLWVFNTITLLWYLINRSWLGSMFSHSASPIQVPKVAPAPETNLRIIVFVDDLDRCEESVILQVLSAINLVLAQCGISVVLSMDKEMVHKAILRKYGDLKYNKCLRDRKELADRYLQKIIQLPLDLPHPSSTQSRRYLEAQLGVIKEHDSAPEKYAERIITPEPDEDAVEDEDEDAIEDEDEDEDAHTVDIIINEPERETIEGNKKRNAHAVSEEREPLNEKSSTVLISDIRSLIFIKYSSAEVDAFFYFHALTTHSKQFLPRGWKVLLNYHGLVRNILCLNNEAINVNGWMVQLISWIFMCWEWEENMNTIIQKWKEVGHLQTSQSNASSLLKIVDHFIEEFYREITKETEFSRKEQNKWNEIAGGDIVKLIDRENDGNAGGEIGKLIVRSRDDVEEMGDGSSQKLPEILKNKLDALERSLAELKKDIREFKKHVTDEWKNHIKDTKDKFGKMHNGKNDKKMQNEKENNLENWRRMRSALQRHDVSMNGIQAFQRFRFNCVSGDLPRH